MSTCRTTLPRCPLAFAAAGYCGSTGCASRSRAADSGSFTGSIADIAASAGLFPLASGVVEAICDFRLDGMPVLLAAEMACGGVTACTVDVTRRGCGAAGLTIGCTCAAEGAEPGDAGALSDTAPALVE